MSSREIALWFEDYNGGLAQGHLHLGQETTTNAYAGHMFFATPLNDKTHEIARFTIEDGKVYERMLHALMMSC
jgi:hypothetical protein